jgi:hypothetical protein
MEDAMKRRLLLFMQHPSPETRSMVALTIIVAEALWLHFAAALGDPVLPPNLQEAIASVPSSPAWPSSNRECSVDPMMKGNRNETLCCDRRGAFFDRLVFGAGRHAA